MENRLVFGVDVTNPSVKSLSESGLETGARGEVFLLNRADRRSRADWSLSFGLNRFVLNGFLVVAAELSSVDGRKGFFLMSDILLAVVAVVVLLLLLLAPRERFLSSSSRLLVDSVTVSVSDVVLIDEVLRLCDLKSIVLSLLTPSIFDKVTSINLSTAKPSTSVVDLKVIWNLDRRSDETSKDEWTQGIEQIIQLCNIVPDILVSCRCLRDSLCGCDKGVSIIFGCGGYFRSFTGCFLLVSLFLLLILGVVTQCHRCIPVFLHSIIISINLMLLRILRAHTRLHSNHCKSDIFLILLRSLFVDLE